MKTSDSTKCWREFGGNGSLITCWWAYKMGQPLKSSLAVSEKLNIHCHATQQVAFLGLYPSEMKTPGHTETYTRSL